MLAVPLWFFFFFLRHPDLLRRLPEHHPHRVVKVDQEVRAEWRITINRKRLIHGMRQYQSVEHKVDRSTPEKEGAI